MLSFRRLVTHPIFAIALIAWSTAPAAAFITPSKTLAAAYAFEAVDPNFDDLSSLRLDFFNYLVPQKLLPAYNPFCGIPIGCRTGVFTYDYSATVQAFTLIYSDGNKAFRNDAAEHGYLNAGALLSIPIFDRTAKVIPAIRIGRAFWQRAGNVMGPAVPAVSVESDPIPASTDPNDLSYAVVTVSTSFTSQADEDMTAWYLFPYVGLRLPHVTLVNYGTQPVYVDSSGIGVAITAPARPGAPFSTDNFRALSALNVNMMPPGQGSSTFAPLNPPPPQILAPADKTKAMIWSAQ